MGMVPLLRALMTVIGRLYIGAFVLTILEITGDVDVNVYFENKREKETDREKLNPGRSRSRESQNTSE
jgi:hypothetical protein